MLYRVSFAAGEFDPIPLPLDKLPGVETDTPQHAVESLLNDGRAPQGDMRKWARVIVTIDECGAPRQVVRFKLPMETPFEYSGEYGVGWPFWL